MQPWHILFQLLKNFNNLKSYNSEILIIWHLWRQSHDQKFLFLYRKKDLCMLQAGFMNIYKKILQEWLYINHCGISWHLVSYTIKFYSSQDFRKHIRGPWWPTSRWRTYPKSMLLWFAVQSKYWSSNKE